MEIESGIVGIKETYSQSGRKSLLMKTITLEHPLQSPALILSKHKPSFKKDFLFIKTQEGVYSLNKQEILFLKSNSNYTTIHMANGERVLCCKTLKYFDEILARYGFVRSHHSYVVNFSRIKLLKLNQGSELILTSGDSIPISRSRQSFIHSLFQN